MYKRQNITTVFSKKGIITVAITNIRHHDNHDKKNQHQFKKKRTYEDQEI